MAVGPCVDLWRPATQPLPPQHLRLTGVFSMAEPLATLPKGAHRRGACSRANWRCDLATDIKIPSASPRVTMAVPP